MNLVWPRSRRQSLQIVNVLQVKHSVLAFQKTLCRLVDQKLRELIRRGSCLFEVPPPVLGLESFVTALKRADERPDSWRGLVMSSLEACCSIVVCCLQYQNRCLYWEHTQGTDTNDEIWRGICSKPCNLGHHILRALYTLSHSKRLA